MPHPLERTRPKHEIADIVRARRTEWMRLPLRVEQRRALEAMCLCRTASLGGHVDRCSRCDYARPSYNSCRNRHCPKCQALAQERWIHARLERVLPVGHFHVVFTVPSELHGLIAFRRKELFGTLLRTATQCLSDFARRDMKATLGITAVLHTWTRDLRFHPHVHCLVTAGGLSLDGARWVPRDKFLFPVNALGKVLRGKMMDAIRQMHGEQLFEGFDDFRDPAGFDTLMRKLAKHRWVVYSKRPFATSDHLFQYLGRYTHRVGIANSRLISVDDHQVTFTTKHDQTTSVAPLEFVRRLAQHILPAGFVKIRHYGLYAGALVRTKLARARELLPEQPARNPIPTSWCELLLALAGYDAGACPSCGADVISCPVPTQSSPRARAPPS